jgi:formate-dependent nitrite reductase membrane component NrfD
MRPVPFFGARPLPVLAFAELLSASVPAANYTVEVPAVVTDGRARGTEIDLLYRAEGAERYAAGEPAV